MNRRETRMLSPALRANGCVRARAGKERGGGGGQEGGNEGDFELMAVIYMGVQRRVCGLNSVCVCVEERTAPREMAG